MNRARPLVFWTLLVLVAARAIPAADPRPTPRETPAGLVDPRIGTGGAGYRVGSAYPGPVAPFGAVALSPDTTFYGVNWGFAHCAGFWSKDPQIRGFSHTHLHGTGIPDLGALLLMPTLGVPVAPFDERSYRSPYSHATERAESGYYAVRLDRTGIRAELTAGNWVGVHRYVFPALGAPVVLVNPSHSLSPGWVKDAEVAIDAAAREMRGFVNMRGEFTSLSPDHPGVVTYFILRFSKPFASFGTWKDGVSALDRNGERGPRIGAFAAFDPSDREPLVVAVGISFQSVERAAANLAAEAADLDFDRVRSATSSRWDAWLSKIEVTGGTPSERRIFATALYHALLMPTDWTESNGKYLGFDGRAHDVGGRRYYTNFSLWDTYRTQHPLLTLLDPARESDMMESLTTMVRQGGVLPMWPLANGETGCMVGDPAAIVLADSYLKGARDFDVQTAYAAARAKATGPLARDGRVGIEDYLARGYVCSDHHDRGPSLTAEYAYADAALGAWAEALGKPDDAALFGKRAENWRNHWDPRTGFLRARRCDGSFDRPFHPKWVFSRDYTEGTAWQWLWYVPHDVPGLVAAFGSKRAFVDKLTAFFEKGSKEIHTIFPDIYYWGGNEPDLLAPYLFAFAGRPDLTQKWVRWAVATKYADTPDGLDGNDDAGTLSAWYVFSALGFYPVAGSDLYVIGSPLFDRAVVHLPGGDLVVIAKDNGPANVYVQSATWNGRPFTTPFFRHADLAHGGTLVFVMGPWPSTWGAAR